VPMDELVEDVFQCDAVQRIARMWNRCCHG
jgi:hypothetical protein